MSDLVKVLRSKLELTAEQSEKEYGHNSMSSMAEGTWMPIGAIHENQRLAPLHEAMLKVVEAAEELCDDWEKFSQDASDECKQLPDIVNRCSLHKRTRNVLAALREIVSK